MSILLRLIRKIFQLFLDTLLKTCFIIVLHFWANYCRRVNAGCLFSSHEVKQAFSGSEVFELPAEQLFWDVSVLKSVFCVFQCGIGRALAGLSSYPPQVIGCMRTVTPVKVCALGE